jgi:hypothetical protein
MGVRLPFSDAGPCEIEWGFGESDAIVLRPYLGTVSLRVTDAIKDIQEEGYGEAPVDAIVQGTTVELDVPLTRLDVDQLEVVLQAARPSGNILVLSSRAGCPMYDDARALVIRPICDNVPDPDTGHWIEIFKTFPFRKIDLPFDRGTQRVILIGFKVFVSQESGHEGEILQIGI